MGEFEEKFIKPIVNASYPGTLAALSLAVLQVSGTSTPFILKFVLLLGALMFLLSAFLIFFHSIYPARRKLWTGTALTFLLGLFCSLLSALLMLFFA
jgi:hypothetical protein